MHCNYCGKVIQEDANLCAYRGNRVACAPAARQRLMRPREGRTIAGVCLGFAEYFDLDVTLIRIIWLIVAIFGGTGFLVYILAWIVMPSEPKLIQAPIGAQQVPNA